VSAYTASLRGYRLAALGAVILAVLGSILACAALAYSAFERELRPEALRKAETVGHVVDALAVKAMRYQLPLEKLPGIDELFDGLEKQNPEITWIAILVDEKPIFARGQQAHARLAENRVELPLITMGDPAVLEIAVDPAWVAHLFREMALDMGVILLVSLVISMELAIYLTGAGDFRSASVVQGALHAASRGDFRGVTTVAAARGEARALLSALASAVDTLAMKRTLLAAAIARRWPRRNADPREREALRAALARLRAATREYVLPSAPVPDAGRVDASNVLGAMRAPFFLFLFSEDLSRSFLPLYAGSLPVGPFAIPVHLVVSLPISIFMLIVALSQPTLGTWSERVGRRRAFLAGGLVGACAHLASAGAGSLSELLVLRAIAGFAWAVAFVAAQGFVIDHTDRDTRTRGLATFVGIIMAASICGPPMGGLLADGLGPRWTFAIGALLATGATLLAWRDLPRAAAAKRAVRPVRARDYAAALANPRFAALLALAAIPAKVIVIAFCFYLVPLYVAESGYNAAMAGRIIMLYSVMMVLGVPITTEVVERIQRARHTRPHALFVAGGLVVSGLAGLLMLMPLGLWGTAVLVFLLGIAQAISIAPQSAMVADVSSADMGRVGESAIYGVYRLIERLGNAMGPVIAAFLLQLAGFQAAFAAIGASVLLCGIAFYAMFRNGNAPARAGART
jgi:predicted MFS family arabinose efflux permease